MKKILPIFFIILFCSITDKSYSQSFELIAPEEVPDTVYGQPESEFLSSSPILKNKSTSTASYKIALAPITLSPGHLFAVCDCASCYTPQENFYQTPNPCVLEPDATSGGAVHVYLYPNNSEGTSIINVNFFNVANQLDNVTYQAVFKAGGVGLNEPVELTLLPADVMPNPAVDNVIIKNISYNNSEILVIEVYDSKGNTIFSQEFKSISSEYEINTSEFVSGVYYYYLSYNLKPVKTGSFIISK